MYKIVITLFLLSSTVCCAFSEDNDNASYYSVLENAVITNDKKMISDVLDNYDNLKFDLKSSDRRKLLELLISTPKGNEELALKMSYDLIMSFRQGYDKKNELLEKAYHYSKIKLQSEDMFVMELSARNIAAMDRDDGFDMVLEILILEDFRFDEMALQLVFFL